MRKRILLAVLALFLLYAGHDLFWPLERDLRRFDAREMGRLETEMWRSYSDRKPAKLFLQLAELLRTQYQFRRETRRSTRIGMVDRTSQRDGYSEGDLGRACSEAAAAIYLISPAAALEHGNLRAQAMTIRDTQAAAGGVSKENWAQIEILLRQCDQSLQAAINHT